MLAGLTVSESAAEIFCSSRNSLFPCGFPILRRPVSVSSPRREKQIRIAAQSALNDGGGDIVFDKELEFTPSFSEYLKAMEFLKNERYSTDKSSDGSSPSNYSPRKKKVFKKSVREEETSSDDEATAVREDSRKSGKGTALYREDSRKGDFREPEVVGKKQNRDYLKVRGRKVSDGSESESFAMERAAFRPLEEGDEVLGKARVTRVDMEERIQKLAKW